jgi:hypothetical protein
MREIALGSFYRELWSAHYCRISQYTSFYIGNTSYILTAMVIALLLPTGLVAFSIICLTIIFRLDAFEEYRRSIRLIIELLFQSGYCPKQIKRILNLYD